jgi:hypothetical protein
MPELRIPPQVPIAQQKYLVSPQALCYYGGVRTTIDLDDELLRLAKITAAERGITLREMWTAMLERELKKAVKNAPRRVQFPLLGNQSSGAFLTEDAIRYGNLEEDRRLRGSQ